MAVLKHVKIYRMYSATVKFNGIFCGALVHIHFLYRRNLQFKMEVQYGTVLKYIQIKCTVRILPTRNNITQRYFIPLMKLLSIFYIPRIYYVFKKDIISSKKPAYVKYSSFQYNMCTLISNAE